MSADLRQAQLPSNEPAEDPRLQAFKKFVLSIDRSDAKLAVNSQRELRALGISVCMASLPQNGGKR